MAILVIYYSRSGNTQQMAHAVGEGVRAEGLEAIVKPVSETRVEELLEADGFILGSPTYYGTLAWPIKQFIDESVKYHGKLVGKVGGAFTSSGGAGGGNETTLLSMLQALLIHGMIIQGTSSGDHYGPVSVKSPDDKALERCRALGGRVAKLAKALADTQLRNM
jgi:NAD(P)H dehydrogenase (quinone)